MKIELLNPAYVIKELQKELAEKDKELAAKDKEIATLKRKLKKSEEQKK